jgi:hypothetical protein
VQLRTAPSGELASGGTVGQSRVPATRRRDMQHEIEWRDWMRQYLGVGGSDCGVPRLGDEGRRVGEEMARGRGEAARRSTVGGRGIKPIGVVPKAEVVRLSVTPRCASRIGGFLRAFRTATPTRHLPQRRAGAASRSSSSVGWRRLSRRHRPRVVRPGECESYRVARKSSAAARRTANGSFLRAQARNHANSEKEN